ncbi:RNA polymerase III RPC4-domain-containing protein [Lentinula aff. lateritia]|uniref:RNA polymerase III RPC4-domain-containing protein n=1 Tax=Lentinula aff. lateritia TaxID=2804960 RepID=A0ACC1UCC0_9AGAR|nr:RNA polymerase III RPC4-domain-containing protein [Lentinula aff. lateritia]
MSETTSGSGSKPKAISSLAKRPSEVTRQGTQKLKFVPTLPARRSKDAEPVPDTIPASSNDRGRGRGRGRGEGSGRGRGVPRPPVEMVASGPFALGPAMAGTSSSRRFAQAATPIPAPSKTKAYSLGAGLSQTAAPKIKQEQKLGKDEQDEEIYSDADEGVEIIDMENVGQMDWMAPDSIIKEKTKRPKKEDPDATGASCSISLSRVLTYAVQEVDIANALDGDEDEDEADEKDLDTIFDDFNKMNYDANKDSQYLCLFQFPSPFPTFSEQPSDTVQTDAPVTPGSKKVTFAPDVKPETDGLSSTAEVKELDGLIGHLEVYRSGARKIRLANGIVLDVSPASQPSFLEHAVHLDMKENKLAILGELFRHYLVAPDIDALLNAMDALDSEENLIRMDIT